MPVDVDFASLFKRSPNPYMVLDRELRYVAANDAYLRVTDKTLEDLVGRRVFDVFPNDPSNPDNESRTRLRESFERVLQTGEPDVLAFIPYRVPRDGDTDAEAYRYWSATHTPITGPDGKVAFILQHTVDVTELAAMRDLSPQIAAGVMVRAEQVQDANVALQRARDELQARADLDRQLSGIVSHDLRNPLNAIGIGLSLLRSGALDPQQRNVTDRMMGSFERAARLIRDFLDFTQARVSGTIPVTPSTANIREVAQSVCDELQPAYPDRQCCYRHSGAEIGRWDPDRLAQLIGNLVSNAMQHSPPGATVSLTTKQDGEWVVIAVHNTGAPIPDADRERLFLPFARGAESRTSRDRSVGLGLFIVRAIVSAHGGTVGVTSSAESGTTFTVTLPYAIMGGSTRP